MFRAVVTGRLKSDSFMAQSSNRWIITILGRTIPPSAIHRVTETLTIHGLHIEPQQPPVPLQPRATPYACERLWIQPAPGNHATLRASLLALSDELAVDIIGQPESEYRQERRLFVFDMDSTLIQGEVIDELAKMAGVADRVVAITASAMRGEIEFQESFRRRVSLLAGLPEARAHELLQQIPLMEGAEPLFHALHTMGMKTAILSGGFTFFGTHLKHRLGVDFVHANELDLDTDRYVTGQVRGSIVDGARKAELLQEIAVREAIPLDQVVAVGDGANDLPMLRLAGMGIAFHAKPIVRASAAYAMTHVGLDGLLELLGSEIV